MLLKQSLSALVEAQKQPKLRTDWHEQEMQVVLQKVNVLRACN